MTKRVFGFRQGDLAEGLGVELLRQVALVAEIPRQEDVGLDAVATLLRRDGNLFYAEQSFVVQFKARPKNGSEHVLCWKRETVEWLLKQQLPVFIGEVSRNPLELKLFSLNVLPLGLPEVMAHMNDSYLTLRLIDRELSVSSLLGENVLCPRIGPPIAAIRGDQIDDQKEIEQVYSVLEKWVAVETLNVHFRLSSAKLQVVDWDDQSGPKQFLVGVGAGLPHRRIDLLNLVVPLERLRYVTNAALVGGIGRGPTEAVDTLLKWFKEEKVTREDAAELALEPPALYDTIPSLRNIVKATATTASIGSSYQAQRQVEPQEADLTKNQKPAE